MKFKTIALLLLLLPGLSAFSGELKTVTLAVDKMTCGMCPITVKKALQKVEGVSAVEAKYEGSGDGWARVSFNPDIASIEDLTFATEMAGYPSRIKP